MVSGHRLAGQGHRWDSVVVSEHRLAGQGLLEPSLHHSSEETDLCK